MHRTVAAWTGRAELLELERALPSGEFRLVPWADPSAELRFGCHADVAILAGPSHGGRDPLRLAHELRTAGVALPLVLIVPQRSPDLAVAACRAGFNEYLRQPFAPADLLAAIRRCFDNGSAGPEAECGGRLVGDSAPMREVKAQIRDVGAAACNVLITGETGTGKELAAELIHQHSARRHRPFVSLNCAAIPDSLWESELFGFEKGAFTGAEARKTGTLETANTGTIFFDEIGEMSPAAQAKMLRAIESRQILRLGSTHPVTLDIRVIAATNRDLEELVESGQFRSDLYFRLGVARIHLPPLRERREDLLLLIDHYVQEFNAQFGRRIEGLSAETMQWMSRHDWPGNVRELRNILEASFVHLPFARMRFLELPRDCRERLAAANSRQVCEADRLRSALAVNNWNVSQAAKALHWSRVTVYRKMAKYHLEKHHRPDRDRAEGL